MLFSTTQAQSDCLDTLGYFLPQNNWLTYSNLTQVFYGDWDAGALYDVKDNNEDIYEFHTWDDQYIYLNFDSSDWPANPYSFDTGYWLPRWWCVGEFMNVSTVIRYWQRDREPWDPNQYAYTWSKIQVAVGEHNYQVSFVQHAVIDMGGNVGQIDSITMHYARPGGWEEFTYGKGFGWVKWVQNDGEQAWFNWQTPTVTGPNTALNPVSNK